MPRLENYGENLVAIDHFISRETAIEWVSNYLQNRQNILNGDFAEDNSVLQKCVAYNSNAFGSLLELDGCIGIRFFNGMDPHDNQVKLIAFGVDSDGKTLYLTRTINNIAVEGGVEYGQKNPPASYNDEAVLDLLT